MKGEEIVRPCDRHSIETVTFRKHVTKYKTMRKWIVDYILENLRIVQLKVVEILILITHIYQFTVTYSNFVRCWGSVVMLTSFN